MSETLAQKPPSLQEPEQGDAGAAVPGEALEPRTCRQEDTAQSDHPRGTDIVVVQNGKQKGTLLLMSILL